MDSVSRLDHLADPANLRAFINAMSDITGTSANAVLREMAMVLQRQSRRRSDDMVEVMRLGRLLQAVRIETDSAHGNGQSSR